MLLFYLRVAFQSFSEKHKGGWGMEREEILRKIEELKSDYVRIQADLEKLTYVGGNGERTEKVLEEIELELKRLRSLL